MANAVHMSFIMEAVAPGTAVGIYILCCHFVACVLYMRNVSMVDVGRLCGMPHAIGKVKK